MVAVVKERANNVLAQNKWWYIEQLRTGGFGTIMAVQDKKGDKLVVKIKSGNDDPFNNLEREAELITKRRECPFVINIIIDVVSSANDFIAMDQSLCDSLVFGSVAGEITNFHADCGICICNFFCEPEVCF